MIIGGGGGLLPPDQSHRQLEVGPLLIIVVRPRRRGERTSSFDTVLIPEKLKSPGEFIPEHRCDHHAQSK